MSSSSAFLSAIRSPMVQRSKTPTQWVSSLHHVPVLCPEADGFSQIAIENQVGYTDCLGYVRDARAKGLKAPVLFMGQLTAHPPCRWS